MDNSSIQSASEYVNNLLLSRGLLRDGQALDFASLAKGGQDSTTAEVVNLVHDLIQRRDRESEHLSTLSQSLQNVHASTTQQAQMIKTLENQKEELQRELSTVKSQLRTAKLDVKSFESKNKAYKEDIQRLRTSVGQIRAQCANDVRKRDTEIVKLKKHVDVQRTRESRNSTGPGGVTIIDPTTGKAHYPASLSREESRPPTRTSHTLQDESNEHLTALSAELSEGNEALTSLVQSTIATLRTLQGLPVETMEVTAPPGDTRPSSGLQEASSAHEPAIQVAETPSIVSLTQDLTETIASLRTLLTEPSFVRYEEVEIREAELERLRAGWETMESRWREAMSLMNAWRQRISGDSAAAPINIEDIQRGMELAEEGLSVAGSPEQRRYRGRKRDSSGSEISQASIDTYNDGVSDVGDTSIVSMGSEGRTEGLDHDGRDPDPTPKLKKLRFDSTSKSTHRAPIIPAPQVLRPKAANARSPTRRPVATRPAPGLSPEVIARPEARRESDAPPASRSDMISPDIWMQSTSTATSQTHREGNNEAIPRSYESNVESRPSTEKQPEPEKPVKRTALPRRMASKRRSSLTPAEMQGLVGR